MQGHLLEYQSGYVLPKFFSFRFRAQLSAATTGSGVSADNRRRLVPLPPSYSL